jgi:hypothetical protein
MTSVHEIETAVQRLAPQERAEFRAWFEAFDAQEWDQQMADDVANGTLDWLAEEALADQAAGRCNDKIKRPDQALSD